MAVLTTKPELLRQIGTLICSNGISIQDVIAQLGTLPPEQLFDVAVLTDDQGTVERLPLSVGADMYPIGIYPFKTGDFCEYYLELTEASSQTRKQAETRRKGNQQIPDIKFWKKLQPVILALNKAMEKLNGVPIAGNYYAQMESQNAIWTVGQLGNFFPDYVIARTRYIGK